MFGDSRIILASDTKYINVANMRRTTHSDLSFDMPQSSIRRSGECFRNDNDEAYYLKRRGFLDIILNELIGEYLSKYMGMDTVN